MISALRTLSQDRLLRIIQLLVLFLSCCVVLAFLRFYLLSSAEAFRQDFERQSFLELSRGETYVIARKLEALSKADQFSCVAATKSGILFFNQQNGNCEAGLWSVRETVREPNQGIEIQFTIRLASSLFLGLLLFLSVQAVLAFTILLSQRRLLFLSTQHERELAAMAAQFAHDVQSPLAILRLLQQDRPDLDQRALRARALERLESLVNFLRGEKSAKGKPESLSLLLASAAQEKETEFKEATSIKIIWKENLGSCQLLGGSFEWRRLLSNILNNAIEASGPEQAKIEITVHGFREGILHFSIRDFGRGPSADALLQAGKKGFSQGKAGGQGLGLSKAREFVTSLGGKIELRSTEGKGAIVEIRTPALQATAVVLIDDDTELGRAWVLAGKAKGVIVYYFSSPSDFFASAVGFALDTAIYLDLELPSAKPDSLELGAHLQNQGFTRLYLCTGRAKNSISRPAWALDIVGKNPPWL